MIMDTSLNSSVTQFRSYKLQKVDAQFSYLENSFG